MRGPRSTPTMAAVAAAAGVSQQTVSRVLHNSPAVSAATSQKVRDTIAALAYRPNLAARALATGSTRVIGALVSSTTLSGPSGALLGIEQTARADGYWISMAGLRSNTAAEVTEVISHFINQGVDGVIAVAQTQMAVDATLTAVGTMPTVLVTSGRVPDGHFTLDIDQAGAARQVMGLLRQLGHSAIAHVSGPTGDLHAEARVEGWRSSLPAKAEAIVYEGDWSSASGYRAGQALLARRPRPSAIFAANDHMAFGVLRALNEAGLRVPRDLSVVGFDNIQGSDCSIPPLTTVDQTHTELGQAAMALILEAMAGQPARRVTIPGRLIVRESTGAPPEANPAVRP